MNDVVIKVEESAAPDQSPEERALVAKWDKNLMHARKKDEPFRKCVVRDRKYATGEALKGYEVSTNLVQATIDTLIPFLYAKNPDVDVVAQDQVSPPPKQRPTAPVPPQGAVDAAGQPILAPDGVPVSPGPEQLAEYSMALAQYQAQMQAEQAQAEEERAQNDMVRRLAQTIEIVVSRLWHKAQLKAEAKKQLRGSMTSAEGWLKISLQGDLSTDPQVQRELYTLQEQLQDIESLKRCIAAGEYANIDEARASLAAKIEGAQARLETYVARCLAIDWVDTLDMQCSLSPRTMSEAVNGPWMADCTYYTLDDIAAKTGMDKAKFASATRWKQPALAVDFEAPEKPTPEWAQEADAWTKTSDADADGMVRSWEIWSRDDNMIYTWVEGTGFWAKPPRPPRFQTTRFYPYFLLALYECDGERHPQSLSYRLAKLQDEYALTRSNFAEVRRRAKPGVFFDKTNVSPTDAQAIEEGTAQEYIGLSPVRPGEPLGNSFAPKPYNSVDAGLYDTAPIRSDMETVSGAKDALSQNLNAPLTATQAEIQNQDSGARTGYSRDALDDMLNDVAQYTAELALQGFTEEQVRKWAGPHAVWPQGIEGEALESLVYVAIRAGSSGKPNTNADRQAWAAIVPQLTSTIMQIGQLRGADPTEMADKLAEVLGETIARTGDKMDVDRFLPMASPAAQAGMAPAGIPAPQGATAPMQMPEPEPAVPGVP